MAGKPLISLSNLKFDRDQLDDYLRWTGRHNAYAGFAKMIEQPDNMMFLPSRASEWKDREQDALFLQQLKFRLPPLSERPLSQALLSDFRPVEVQMDLQGYGATETTSPSALIGFSLAEAEDL